MDNKTDRWSGLTTDDSLFCMMFVFPLVAIPIAMIVFTMTASTPEIYGTGLGSLAVFLIVRRVNRRHDPLRQKRPPDAP